MFWDDTGVVWKLLLPMPLSCGVLEFLVEPIAVWTCLYATSPSRLSKSYCWWL